MFEIEEFVINRENNSKIFLFIVKIKCFIFNFLVYYWLRFLLLR